MNVMGLASLAIAFVARPAVLIRYPAGVWGGNGRYTEAAATRTDIKAVIQNSTEEDIRVLPEGERTDGYVTIWSSTVLMTADETAGTKADEIETPEGKVYRIVRSGLRAEGGYTRAIGRLTVDRGRNL
jgi:hypothetical protein